MPNELQSRLDAAVRFALAAGDHTLGPFRAQRFAVDLKRDGSVVTEIDRSAETLLRSLIQSDFPDDAILGEEHDDTPGTSGYRWVLDPIDGTASFVRGVPLYGTLVAVEHEGRSVVGVIHMPALDETVYAGAGMGAWHRVGDADPMPARVSSVGALSDAMVTYTSHDYFSSNRQMGVFHAINDAAKSTRGWSDCYAHVLVATGRADAAVEPGINLWDVAPMTVIHAEAGGRATGWSGEVTAAERFFLASNGTIHDELLDLIAKSRTHAKV